MQDRYTTEELLMFRGYLECRHLHASCVAASSFSKFSWPPYLDETLRKLREDTAGLSDWDLQPKH